MNDRERILRTLQYKPVDKLPLQPGYPRESTLKRWTGEGLPEGADWRSYVMDAIGVPAAGSGPQTATVALVAADAQVAATSQETAATQEVVVPHAVDTKMIPTFEEKVLRHENGHYVVRDWMGAITEISDKYDYTYIRSAKDFVTRKWHKFPVETSEDWQEMKKRYDPDDPSRYPEGMGSLAEQMAGRDYVSRLSINGPFWQLREWMGFENLCIAFVERPEFVAEMVEFWCSFGLRIIERVTSKIPIDSLNLSEDMAFKAHSMISPAMAREFLMPVYKKWAGAAKKNGVQLVDMDSDGYVDELIPIWIESGINVCDPVEVAAHNDIALYAAKYGTAMAYTGGVDKRAIAVGGKTMEAEVRRVTAPFLKTGGLLPGCDHGVPHDISLQNFIDYTKLLAQLSGWL